MTFVYREWVGQWAGLLESGRKLPAPQGEVARRENPGSAGGARGRVVVFSPHPDDECLAGVLPLRLLKESRMEVINYTVTLGSKTERKAERREELAAAVALLGFRSCIHEPLGWDAVNETTRRGDQSKWSLMVAEVAQIIRDNKPVAIFFPSLADDHPTHRGTHYLVMDALGCLRDWEKGVQQKDGGLDITTPPSRCAGPPLLGKEGRLGEEAAEPFLPNCSWRGYLVESAYWGSLPRPNLFVEAAVDDVALLVEACACHRGETARTACHLRLPALLIDSVRRAEMIIGPGEAPPVAPFGFLYGMEFWDGEKVIACCSSGCCIEVGKRADICFLKGDG